MSSNVGKGSEATPSRAIEKKTKNEEDEISEEEEDSDDEGAEEKSAESERDDGEAEADAAADNDDETDNEESAGNQFDLIYPSKRNPEENFVKFMDYAQRCYEQFTGSYSKKHREAREAAKQQ